MQADSVTRKHLLDDLHKGCESLGLSLTQDQYQHLLQYLDLLQKWNRAYNLTAVRDARAMVFLHLLDSLSVAPHIRGGRFVDVGTGAGLPGIPLAILFPERAFTLLDSNGKKTRFLFQAKQALALKNVAVVNARVEAFQPTALFDGVISRAFASLVDMVDKCEHLLSRDGLFYAMKGVYPQAELSELKKPYIVVDSHQLVVPGVDGERCLLAVRPQQV